MANTAIVCLLLDWDGDAAGLVNGRANRQDGTPFTESEIQLMRRAGRAELEAVQTYYDAAQEYHADRLHDFKRLGELLTPAFAGLPEDSVLPEALARLSDTDRREALDIFDRLAPDGYLHINR